MEEKHCSYCNGATDQVGFLAEGRNKTFICASCSERVNQAFLEAAAKAEQDAPQPFVMESIPHPREIVEHLNQHVIGQDNAKRKLAVEVHSHYLRLLDNEEITGQVTATIVDEELKDVEIEKNNIILLGPSGSGKTLLAQSIANFLKVPFAIGDATTITEAGYVGEDVENLLLKLLIAADFDVEAAQRGIIFVDEIDKLRKTGGNTSLTRDVSGEGVQQSLLKMLEGTISNVPINGGRKHPEAKYVQMDTTNILFIVGGAFVGLDEVINKRLNNRKVGFANVQSAAQTAGKSVLGEVTPDDLMSYGLIPELVGRLPVVATLEELSVKDMVRILTEPKNALTKQIRKLFLRDGIQLRFTAEAIDEIAEKAKKQNTGARALRNVMSTFMDGIRYNVTDEFKGAIMITKDVVNGASPFGEPMNKAA